MDEQLKALLDPYIDARLAEIGLVEAAEPEPEKPAKGKAGKGGKAKAPTHTRDECQAKMLELIKKENKQAAIDLLGEFDAKKLADIKPDQMDAFYARLEELLGGEEDGGDDDELFG